MFNNPIYAWYQHPVLCLCTRCWFKRRCGILFDILEGRQRSTLNWLLIIVVLMWGSLSTYQIARGALGESGGNDIYTYWYAGLHIRQGTDPYRAFLDGRDPDLPITFLNGEAIAKDEVVRSDLQPAPGLTFPLILLLTPFSWLSFQSAKIGWFILLMAMNLLIPGLLLRAIHRHQAGSRFPYLPLLAIFMGFSSTRYASISGQPSILVIVFMLLAWIWAEDRPYLAGLLLGVALSKYSLALGFWIYFTFFEWRPKLSLSAAGVQVVGLIVLAGLGNSNVLEAIDGYIQLFLHHAPMEGIQLTSLLPGINAYSPPLAIALTAIVGIPLFFILKRIKAGPRPLESRPIVQAMLLTVLTFWSLMVAYHRAYDLQVFIIALGSTLLLRTIDDQDRPKEWVLRSHSAYAVLSIIMLSLPAGGILRSWLPEDFGPIWIRLVLRASTWVILIGIGLAIASLFHVTRPSKY